MHEPAPWPKGPFPERYTARAVLGRLERAWDEPGRAAAVARLAALGTAAHPVHRDALVRVVVGPTTLEAARSALEGTSVTAFRWRSGVLDDRMGAEPAGERIGLVPSADPIDALSAVGVASPRHGIGTAALVRFVTTLRSLAPGTRIDALAEDAIELALPPLGGALALRVASRACALCAPLAARGTAEALATALTQARCLELSWR